jgi:hypothetical protein
MVKEINITKVDTWLPIFPGFYNTIFEASGEEEEVDEINRVRTEKGWKEIGYDDCDWDYDSHRKESVEGCVDSAENTLKELGMVDKITLQKLSSPKFYNYSNDAIHVEMKLTDKNKDTIETYLKDNEEKFAKYVSDMYTSCDGFSSSYSNQLEDWMDNLKDEVLEHDHKLGSILEFIMKNEDEEADLNMYYDMEVHGVYAKNYDELQNTEIVSAN